MKHSLNNFLADYSIALEALRKTVNQKINRQTKNINSYA